eukprot:11026981-Ditylum_brightwellii.AAC.1
MRQQKQREKARIRREKERQKRIARMKKVAEMKKNNLRTEGEPVQITRVAKTAGWYRACVRASWYTACESAYMYPRLISPDKSTNKPLI